jgi:signal transduction histidine kinase
MWAYFSELLNADSLSPHGICLLWRPDLIWTHATSDLLIGISYFSIPVALAYLVSRRPDVSFNWVIWCFAAFILACGTTHFLSIWTLWVPDYGLEALVKAITAAISVATAVLMWPMLGKALAWPSPAQLAAANRDLTALVKERDEALVALRRESIDRQKAEEMLRQAQKMEAIGQLTGGIAHDFNNLLTVVSMNLDRLEGALRTHADAGVTRSVTHARSAADKAAGITARMLSFARMAQVDPMALDVRDVLEEMEPLFRNAVQEPHTLVFDFDTNPCPVHVDRQQLENAVLNLAINARDAMAEKGIVRITVVAEQEMIAIGVTDDGEGMSDHVRERVFEPFFTTKAVGKGSGLGLSQVYGFVQQSGGLVDVVSAPGQGTAITIRIPRTGAAK